MEDQIVTKYSNKKSEDKERKKLLQNWLRGLSFEDKEKIKGLISRDLEFTIKIFLDEEDMSIWAVSNVLDACGCSETYEGALRIVGMFLDGFVSDAKEGNRRT